MANMTCARGHVLTAPYIHFDCISVTGLLSEDDQAALLSVAERWEAIDADGNVRGAARYLCLSCFLELIAVMDTFCANG